MVMTLMIREDGTLTRFTTEVLDCKEWRSEIYQKYPKFTKLEGSFGVFFL